MSQERKKRKSHLQNETMQKISKLIRNYVQKVKILTYGDIKDDFSNVITDKLFIDKSLFISEILKDDDRIFLTVPKCWGKTLNLAMLKAFLSPDVKESMTLAWGNSLVKTFEGLKIGKEKPEIIRDYEGQVPVVHLALSNVNGTDQNIIESHLRKALSETFKEHDYVLKWMEAKKSLDVRRFISYRQQSKKYTLDCGSISDLMLDDGLPFLCECVQNYFGKKVFLLIDQFDRPVQDLYNEVIVEQDGRLIKKHQQTIKNISIIMQDIVRQSNGSNRVQKVLITGQLNVQIKDTNNPFIGFFFRDLINSNYSAYFGFNENEIKEQILKPIFDESFEGDYETQMAYDELFNTLKLWYNGFNFNENKGIFNPFSVMTALKGIQNKQQPKIYWENQMIDNLMQRVIQSPKLKNFNDKLFQIIQKREEIDMADLEIKDNSLSVFLKEHDTMKSQDIENLAFSMFIQYGYLTITNNQISLPNNEQKYIFVEQFLNSYIKNKQIRTSNKQIYEILEGEDNEFILFINSNLQKLQRSHQTENQLQAFMYCIFYGNLLVNNLKDQSIDLKYDIQLEKTAFNGGRIDTIFFPIDKNQQGYVIIHEYKKFDKDQGLENRKESACWRIVLGNYLKCAIEEKLLYKTKWNTVIIRGMVFYCDKTRYWNLGVKQKKINFEEAIIIQDWIDKETNKGLKKNEKQNEDKGKQKIKKNYKLIKNEICEKYKIKNFDGFISYVLNNQKEQKETQNIQNLILGQTNSQMNLKNVGIQKEEGQEISTLNRIQGQVENQGEQQDENRIEIPAINYRQKHIENQVVQATEGEDVDSSDHQGTKKRNYQQYNKNYKKMEDENSDFPDKQKKALDKKYF